MLTVILGKYPELNYRTANYFDAIYDPNWLKDDFVKEIILNIDKSEVIDSYLIKSPVLGLIPPQMLSGGVKTLILTYMIENEVFNGSQLGDNCAEMLLKISELVDRRIWFGHIFGWLKYINKDYESEINTINIELDGSIYKVSTFGEIYDYFFEHVDGDYKGCGDL